MDIPGSVPIVFRIRLVNTRDVAAIVSYRRLWYSRGSRTLGHRHRYHHCRCGTAGRVGRFANLESVGIGIRRGNYVLSHASASVVLWVIMVALLLLFLLLFEEILLLAMS